MQVKLVNLRYLDLKQVLNLKSWCDKTIFVITFNFTKYLE